MVYLKISKLVDRAVKFFSQVWTSVAKVQIKFKCYNKNVHDRRTILGHHRRGTVSKIRGGLAGCPFSQWLVQCTYHWSFSVSVWPDNPYLIPDSMSALLVLLIMSDYLAWSLVLRCWPWHRWCCLLMLGQSDRVHIYGLHFSEWWGLAEGKTNCRNNWW